MTSSISPQEIRIGRMRVLYDSTLLPEISADFFRPREFAGVAEIHGQTMGRGEALFFAHAGQPMVLRHYRRGGFVRHFVADRYPGVRRGASRSFREWRLLADLYRQGLPVPRPVAASFCPAGLFYRADLVTCQIENVRPLSILLRERLPADLWRALGETIRRFHNAQVFHADLNAHNILIDSNHDVYLIDFDRGAIRTGDNWKQTNLQRLLRSLHKLTQGFAAEGAITENWNLLLSAYRQTSS